MDRHGLVRADIFHVSEVPSDFFEEYECPECGADHDFDVIPRDDTDYEQLTEELVEARETVESLLRDDQLWTVPEDLYENVLDAVMFLDQAAGIAEECTHTRLRVQTARPVMTSGSSTLKTES